MPNEFKISELDRVKTIGAEITREDKFVLNNGSPQTTRSITMQDLIDYLPDEVGVSSATPGTNISITGSETDNLGRPTGDITISVPTGAGGVKTIASGNPWVTITPAVGRGDVTVSVDRGAGGVSGIEAGNNITINPSTGIGNVRIDSTAVSSISTDGNITVSPANGQGDVTLSVPNGLVNRIVAGSNINIDPTSGQGIVTISAIQAEQIDPGVTKIIQGSGITISPASGVGDVSINANVQQISAGTGIGVNNNAGNHTITNTGVTSIAAGSNVTVSGSTGAVTISATGGGDAPGAAFAPIQVHFRGLELQVRFFERYNNPRGKFDDFKVFKRVQNGNIQDSGVAQDIVAGSGSNGGMLHVDNWPICWGGETNNPQAMASPVIDFDFPSNANCALVVIQQKARILHNMFASAQQDNTHLSYYTRVHMQPVAGGNVSWRYPNASGAWDEGNNGVNFENSQYLITQFAMQQMPHNAGADLRAALRDPNNPAINTWGGLAECYRYGADCNNLIVAYCDFTPGCRVQLNSNTRILRSKRSIFDMSGAIVTFFPFNRTSNENFPGIMSDVAGAFGGISSYRTARNIDSAVEEENKFIPDMTDASESRESAEIMRKLIKDTTSTLITLYDYGDLTIEDQGHVEDCIKALLLLQQTPADSNKTLTENTQDLLDAFDDLVYENDDIMRIGNFKFDFQNLYEDTPDDPLNDIFQDGVIPTNTRYSLF